MEQDSHSDAHTLSKQHMSCRGQQLPALSAAPVCLCIKFLSPPSRMQADKQTLLWGCGPIKSDRSKRDKWLRYERGPIGPVMAERFSHNPIELTGEA